MNYYVVLGLGREASPEEIKRAYRRLARKYHPDINPGDRAAAEYFRQITEAYETLVDPARRRDYDTHDEVPSAPVESRYRFAGFDFSVHVEGQKAPTFGDLFSDVLAGAAAVASGPERGADLHASAEIALEEVARGAERGLTLTRLERCGPCGGRGVLRGAEAPCRLCEGSGELRTIRGHMVFRRTCGACGGSGVTRARVCHACGGEGVGVRTDVVRVIVPPGVTTGNVLTVPGQGHAGRRGGAPGDLHVTIEVQPHPVFTREGDDLRVEVPVAVHEAALGARIDVPALDGPARLRVPPGTQSGHVFRLRERGLPAPRHDRRGDLVVTVRLVLPPVLDERSRALLEEFGRLNPGNVRQHLGV
jgi:molecular chaperone DnaJ